MADDVTTDVLTVKDPPKQRSYFNTNKVKRFSLDDGISYIEHKKMDEGTYQRFQNLTSKIKLDSRGETTEVDMKIGDTREFLVENLTVAWNLVDENDEPLGFSPKGVLGLPPDLVADLIEDIYKNNPVLGGSEEGKVTT